MMFMVKPNKTLHFHCGKTCKHLQANGSIRQLSKQGLQTSQRGNSLYCMAENSKHILSATSARLSKYQVAVKHKPGTYLRSILLFYIFFSNLLDSKLGNNSRISQTNSRLYDLKKCWKKYGFHVLNQISNSADEFVRHHCTEMMKFTVYACNKA